MYTEMKYDTKLNESSEIIVEFHQAWLEMKPLQSTRRVSFNCGYSWVGSLYLNFQNDQEWTSVATTPVHFSFWIGICANTRVEYKYINQFILPEVRDYFGDPDSPSASAQFLPLPQEVLCGYGSHRMQGWSLFGIILELHHHYWKCTPW